MEVDKEITISDLLRRLQIAAERVAVELNLEVVEREEFTKKRLAEGDKIEIITFVGGGRGKEMRYEFAGNGEKTLRWQIGHWHG